MSSLTSLGVNKNTTRFIPKTRHLRKPRKRKITPPLSDTEEGIKCETVVTEKNIQFQHHQEPKKVPCPYLRKPPTPPFFPQPDINGNRKIPTIVAEEEGSLPDSPPDDEYTPSPILLEEEVNLDELRKTIQEERRKRKSNRIKNTCQKKRKALKTLDDIDYDPSATVNLESPMSEYTKDLQHGIVSHSFKHVELARRQKIQKELQTKRKSKIVDTTHPYRKADSPINKRDLDTLTESAAAPQVRLVDGEIILDVDSLVRKPIQVDHERQQQEGELEVVEENEYTRKINSSTYTKRSPGVRWSELETKDFYDAISQFGTDFEMISKIMPGRTRRNIRNKFSKEERDNPDKLSKYLMRIRKLPDLEKYSAITGEELEEVPYYFMEEKYE